LSIKTMTLKSSLSQSVAPPSLRFQTSDPLLARLELMSRAVSGVAR
jgi:hypothetical protein